MTECEACKSGIGESWGEFVENLEGVTPESLDKELTTWWKRAVDCRLGGCRKHAEEASDRRDWILNYYIIKDPYLDDYTESMA